MQQSEKTMLAPEARNMQGDAWTLPKAPAAARRRALQKMILERGSVAVSDIARDSGLSEMTIRRDLKALELAGVVERSHGGAISARGGSALQNEPSFEARSKVCPEAKTAIGKAAAAMIDDHEVVGLDVGSTVARLAGELRGRNRIGVVTSSLQAVMAMLETDSLLPDTFVLGGHLRPAEASLCGRIAREQLEELWMTKFFLGTAALSADGVFDYSPEEADLKAAYIEHAAEVVVLCDSSKFGQRSFVKVCGLDAISVLVTDAEPPAEIAAALARAGVEVVVAPVEASTSR